MISTFRVGLVGIALAVSIHPIINELQGGCARGLNYHVLELGQQGADER